MLESEFNDAYVHLNTKLTKKAAFSNIIHRHSSIFIKQQILTTATLRFMPDSLNCVHAFKTPL